MLLVLERSPATFQQVKTALEEGVSPVRILNLIDAAVERTPTSASVISAATYGFDQIRNLVTESEREEFLALVGTVNRQGAPATALKVALFKMANRHHATALLEGTYFDDVRSMVENA